MNKQINRKQSGHSLFEVAMGAAIAAVMAGVGIHAFTKTNDKTEDFTNQVSMVEQAEAGNFTPCFERIDGVLVPCQKQLSN